MAKTIFSAEPASMKYMRLPDRPEADVWLRKNIEPVTVEEPGPDGRTVQTTYWQADEVYFRTEITAAEVAERFDELYEAPPAPAPVYKPPGQLERLEAIEAAMLELAEVIYGG